jgi:hypothetical protein
VELNSPLKCLPLAGGSVPFRVTRSWAVVVLVACAAVATAGWAIAVPSSRSAAAVQLTGRQLAAALVPVSALPRGYHSERYIGQASGDRLETAVARYDLATMSCAAIYEDDGRAGFGESAFAEAGYFRYVSGSSGTGFVQQVYQFRTANAAASFWHGLRAIFVRCPGLGEATSPDPGKITQRVVAARYGRDQAFEADETVTGLQAGAVNQGTLVVVAGDDVFTADVVGYSRPVPANPSARTLMSELIARVQAAR